MLKKQNRLKSRFEFKVTRKYGTRYEGNFITIYTIKPSSYEGAPRIGIIVSNRFDKIAPKRNKVKRIIREIIRKNIKKLPNNTWTIIYPKKELKNASYEEIATDINKTIQKILISS